MSHENNIPNKNKLWRITLDTNPEDCNYHCIMCEEHSRFSDFKQRLGGQCRRMPLEWLDKIFQEASALGIREVIPSTMGEPLLYQGISRFYELAQQHRIKVNLTTNGSFPGKPMSEWAKIIIPNTSDVKISVNGATKKTSESIMQGSNFNHQIDCIQQLVAYRNQHFKERGYYCRITLQVTFMQNNMHELADIVKMAAQLDVDRIKGHHLWPHFPELQHLSMKKNSTAIATWNRYVDEAFAAREKFRKPNGEKIKLENIVHLQDLDTECVDVQSECPFLGRELWIAATGKISPCCAPDELRQQLGDFGNIQTSSLNEVIHSESYQDICKNYKEKDLCKKCNMRRY